MDQNNHTNLEHVTVDVIIPYCEEFTPRPKLKEAIGSAKEQSVRTNIIVVEDKVPKSVASARNRGLNKSQNRYVAFLDADDLWKEQKLEKQLRDMAATGNSLSIEGNVNDTTELLEGLLFGNISSVTSSIVIDTESIDVNFRPELVRFEDHMFIIEASLQGGVCSRQDLVDVRKHEQGLSANETPYMHLEARMQMAEILEQYEETDQYTNRLKGFAFYAYGRQIQLLGAPRKSIYPFLKSLRYYVSMKPILAIILGVYLVIKQLIHGFTNADVN